MTQRWYSYALALALLVASALPAFAQGASTISGNVADSGGGVIPGATVLLTNEAGTKFQAVTNGEGAFTVPALGAGTYKVSVSLSGFKTWNSEVRLAPNTPLDLKVVLEVGSLTETVVVSTGSELVNTQTATVSSTLNADQLNRMPTPSRNALNAVTFLPGVNTTSSNRNSTVIGLPQSMINITLDGVSNNDNFNKTTDGFFASVTPRQDAVEAVTVTLAVSGASSGGSGAVTIGFQTRSGTNRLTGSTYEYLHHPDLNSNYWFNTRNDLPKNDVKVYQHGFRVGGPVVIPGVYDGRNKAFYFGHFEELRFPNSFTRTRTVYVPEALDGWFFYNVAGVVRKVNVIDLARTNGQTTAKDPLMMTLLNRIDTATKSGIGTVKARTNPLLNDYIWQSPGKLQERQPTVRLDYNLTTKHRLSGSAQSIFTFRDPDYLNGADRRFPGAPNFRVFKSTRPLYSIAMRSVLSPSLVNELRGGFTAVGGAGSRFGQPNDPSVGVGSFSDEEGFAIDLPTVTDWFTENGPSWRAAPTYNIDETVNWQVGRHSLNFGGSYLHSGAWEASQTITSQISFGVNTNFDPANAMFSQANFPDASTNDLNNARDLYATLTGRVSTISGQAALDSKTNKYVAFGPRKREGFIDVWSAFAQDNWRVTPTTTISAGLRWDVQLPFAAGNDTMSTVAFQSVCGQSGLGDGGTYSKCSFFSPGKNTGLVPEFVKYSKGTQGYNTDWNNVGPSLSIAWRPNASSGFFGWLLGDPEQATLRGGYAETFERQGLGVFTGVFGGNSGSTISLSRTAAIGNLVLPGESWPILLSERNRIYNQSFTETPSYPIAMRAGRADSISAFAPDIVIASARTWTVSFQRSISRDMAVDVRYVGTRSVNQWTTINYNERDILSNGFYDEFKLAVENLRANNLAGGSRAGSFAFFGPGSGTSPLPIYLAYINGRTAASDPASYTGNNWTNTSNTDRLVFVNPNPGGSASDLDGNSTFRNNAITAGRPANFFVVNPLANNVNIRHSDGFGLYHSLQIDLRRRLSRGLSADVNYQYALESGGSFLGLRYGRVMNPSENVRHAIKTEWDWTVPIGRNQKYLSDVHPIIDGIVGGWSFNGVGRVQARMVDFGNVRLIGMTAKDVQNMYKHEIRIDPATGLRTVYMMPDDVILNTRRAFSFSGSSLSGYSGLGAPEGRYFAPANSPTCTQLKSGDCGVPRYLMIRAPWFSKFDVGIAKRFALAGRSNVEVRLDMMNVFETVNFNTSSNPGSGTTIFQVGGAYQDPNNTFDPGGRIGQFMMRFNW